MAQGIKERFDSPEEEQRLAGENVAANLRVAIPGIIDSFNPATQTATVQPAISENVRLGQEDAKPTNLPLLTDVPCVFPRAGGYCLTFPVKKGDECLLVFSDMCIDGWWQSGGVQGQIETRRHDLSDAAALLGITSVPRAVTEYSGNSVMLRNEEKTAYVEIDNSRNIHIFTQNNLTLEASAITMKVPSVQVEGSLSAAGPSEMNGDITVNGNLTVDGNADIAGENTVSGIAFTEHTHGGVLAGAAQTDIPQ